MNQVARRLFLIQSLLKEKSEYESVAIPHDDNSQKQLLRSLMNVRMPRPIDSEFLKIQDEYLQTELEQACITKFCDLVPIENDLYLWQGDITKLKCDAIVNAANLGMTGCYVPCHACIDNCIHSFAGIQLRLECAKLMQEQGFEEPAGQAKITQAYNLPCDYVIHTVGPIVDANANTGAGNKLTTEHEKLLASCYRSCLELSECWRIGSIAFCCISTGEFHFPNERAAEIAVSTVRQYKAETGSGIKVIFDVFKDADREIYERLLGSDSAAKKRS